MKFLLNSYLYIIAYPADCKGFIVLLLLGYDDCTENVSKSHNSNCDVHYMERIPFVGSDICL